MKHHKTKAFTLIEVIVALALVAIALVALLRLHLMSIQLAQHNQWTQRATQLTQEKLEQSLMKGFPKIGLTSGIEKFNDTELHWQVKIDHPVFSSTKLNSLNDLRKIDVTAQWQQGRHKKHIQMSSYIARRM